MANPAPDAFHGEFPPPTTDEYDTFVRFITVDASRGDLNADQQLYGLAIVRKCLLYAINSLERNGLLVSDTTSVTSEQMRSLHEYIHGSAYNVFEALAQCVRDYRPTYIRLLDQGHRFTNLSHFTAAIMAAEYGTFKRAATLRIVSEHTIPVQTPELVAPVPTQTRETPPIQQGSFEPAPVRVAPKPNTLYNYGVLAVAIAVILALVLVAMMNV